MQLIKQKTLILASSSPRRQELIRLLQLPVEIVVSHADETVSPGMKPSQVVETLSLRKAKAVAEQLKDQQTDGIVIGSDTVVVLDNSILGKPRDEREAFEMLRSLQGRTHEVFSGVACIDLQTAQESVASRMTKVTMKPLSSGQIQRYISSGEPMDKAGSYGIQGLGAVIVERIEGDYFNVVGLPLNLLGEMLSGFGVEIL